MEGARRSLAHLRRDEDHATMSGDLDRLRLLSLAAREQRARLRARIGATRSRLAPAQLKNDARIKAEAAITDAARSASDTVRRHPLATGMAVAGALAWTFRDPLLRHGPTWLRHAYDRLAGHLPFSHDDAQASHAVTETAADDSELAYNDNDGSDEMVPQQEDTPRNE